MEKNTMEDLGKGPTALKDKTIRERLFDLLNNELILEKIHEESNSILKNKNIDFFTMTNLQRNQYLAIESIFNKFSMKGQSILDSLVEKIKKDIKTNWNKDINEIVEEILK